MGEMTGEEMMVGYADGGLGKEEWSFLGRESLHFLGRSF
jgi:hypothetical protein